MKRFSWPLTLTFALLVSAMTGCVTQHGYPARHKRATATAAKSSTRKKSPAYDREWVFPTGDGKNGAQQAKDAEKNARKLVKEVRKWIGTPYRYAGNTRSGVDCSGLMMEIYLKVEGVKLPRSAASQQQFCQAIAKSQLQPGDLVFFSTTGTTVTHVGMYTGQGMMVHASPTYGVVEVSLGDSYFVRNYHSSGRVLGHAMPAGAVVTPAAETTAPAEVTLPAVRPPVNPTEVRLDSLNQVLDSLINNAINEPDFFD